MTIAIFPGSFDPITLGHQDVALRAAKVFDKVYFGVYANPNKNVMFSLDERVKFAKATFKDVENIIVTSYDGLTVDFAKKVGASVMVRGLRVSADFEYEFEYDPFVLVGTYEGSKALILLSTFSLTKGSISLLNSGPITS